jgi:hypothetical protein
MATLADINATLQMQTDAIGRQADAVTKSNEILDAVRQRLSDMLAVEQNALKESRRSDERARKKGIEDKRETTKTLAPKGFMSGFAQGTGFSWLSDFMSNTLGNLFGAGGSLLGKLTGAIGLAAGKLAIWTVVGTLIATYFGDELKAFSENIKEYTGIDLAAFIGENPLVGFALTALGGFVTTSLISGLVGLGFSAIKALGGLALSKVAIPLLSAAYPKMIAPILSPLLGLLTGPTGLALLVGAAIIGSAVLIGNYLEEKRGDFIKEIDGAVSDGIAEIKGEKDVSAFKSLAVKLGLTDPTNTSEMLIGLEQTLDTYRTSVKVGSRGPMSPEMRAKSEIVDMAQLERSLGKENADLIRGQLSAINESINTPGFLTGLSVTQLNQLKEISKLVNNKTNIQLIEKALAAKKYLIENSKRDITKGFNPYTMVDLPSYVATGGIEAALLGKLNNFNEFGVDRDRQRTSATERGISTVTTTVTPLPSDTGSTLTSAGNAAKAFNIRGGDTYITNPPAQQAQQAPSIMMQPVGTVDPNIYKDVIMRYGRP